jgi:hypothetical protein
MLSIKCALLRPWSRLSFRQNRQLLQRCQSYHRTISNKSASSVGSASSNSINSESRKVSKTVSLDQDDPVDNVVSSTTVSIMKSLPPDAQLYAQLARFDKPIGTMLLLWPCMWSTALASGSSITNEIASAATVSSTTTSFASLSSIAGDPKLLV